MGTDTNSAFGLAIHPVADEAEFRRAVARLSRATRDRFDEIFGFQFGEDGPPRAEASSGDGEPQPLRDDEAVAETRRCGGAAVRFFHNPEKARYGVKLEAVLAYAEERGFSHLILAEPRVISDAGLTAVLERIDAGAGIVLGIAAANEASGQLALEALARFLLNRLLGLRVRAYTHSIRACDAAALHAVPFHANADGPIFDLQLMLQFRALGASLDEIEVPVEDDAEQGIAAQQPRIPFFAALATALRYRLHQLHLSRRREYILEPPVSYTYKRSPYSSHSMIVNLIDPDTRVLDLGCSQGLLATPLSEKGVQEITGVDVIPPEFVSKLLDSYHRQDLHRLSELEDQRSYDYVICADVLEHLTTPEQVLRDARWFLKPNGRLIASTGNIALWFYRLSLLLGRFEYGRRGILDDTHVHLYTRSTFRNLIQRSGYQIVDEHFTGLPFEVVFESTGKSRVLRVVGAAYQLMVRVWPEMFAYQTIVVAEIARPDAVRGEGLVAEIE